MINTKPQSYSDGDTELAGEFFVDTSEPTSGRRAGVMLVHGGAGLDDHARQQARRYAELGYVVLACDMFGRGVAGGRREQVIALRDAPDRLVRRARAGLDGGAEHGFTHVDAEPGAIPGVAYQEQADTLSFAATRDFLARAFGENR